MKKEILKNYLEIDNLKILEDDTVFYLDKDEHIEECNNAPILRIAPTDFFAICDELGIRSIDLILEYLNCVKDSETGFLAISNKVENNVCSFCKSGHCILKDSKPIQCKIHPLMRMKKIENGKETVQYFAHKDITQKKNDKSEKEYTLKAFLDEINIVQRDIEDKLYLEHVMRALKRFDFKGFDSDELIPIEERNEFYSVLTYIYYEYEPKSPLNKPLEERIRIADLIIDSAIEKFNKYSLEREC